MEINIKRIVVNFLSCFIINRKKRKDFRERMLIKRIRCNDADKYCTGIPIEPWAYIRARNEIGTIDSCLKSILPVIKKGVIGYNDCDDGTEEYILEFCKQNPGFIPAKYPYSVYPPSHEAYKLSGEEEKKCHTYSNFVLSKIPKGEWLIKVDCDHVFNAEKLKKIFYLPKNDNDCIILPRLNLYYDKEENKVYTSKKTPYVDSKDFWLLKNNNLKFVLSKWIHREDGKEEFRACEDLYVKNKNLIYVELNNYHFPTVKNWRGSKIDKKLLIPLKEYIKTAPIGTKIDVNMLDENKILDICQKLNVEHKRILP